MWECGRCKKNIEDKYKHCWNCGEPKTEVHQVLSNAKIDRIADESPSDAESARRNKFSDENVPPQVKIPPNHEFSSEDRPKFKILKLIPLFLWFAAFLYLAGLTYFSYQRMDTFESRIEQEANDLSKQKDQFVFSKNAAREKGTVKGKVLPLNVQNNELARLYHYLPDDLRPANLDEVKTILWLDCKSNEFGRYEDNSIAYQEKCNAYLVDKNSSKIIQVEDFLGEPPPLKKEGSGDKTGKVLPETYISYIKTNQLENERRQDRFASDSPNHHFFTKSELIYAILGLCVLSAIGIGWLAYKVKFSDWDPG